MKNSSSPDSSTFEKVLDDVGSDGRYQIWILLWFLCPFSFLYAFGRSNGLILLTTPKHFCNAPCHEWWSGYNEEEWQNLTVPWVVGPTGKMERSSCHMYNISDLEIYDGVGYCRSHPTFSKTSTMDCQYGWEFDQSIWEATPVTTFEMVCDRKHFVSMIFSLDMAANAIGTFFFSILADRYGRLPIYYVTLLMSLCLGVGSSFAQSLPALVATRFLLNLCYYTLYQMPYIIAMELCSARLRNLGSMMSFITYFLASPLIALIAWLTANWRIYLLVTHLPSLICLLYYKKLPESPRWLLSVGRTNECEKILRKVAAYNGRTPPEDMGQLLLKAEKEEKQASAFSSLKTSRILIKRLIMMSLLTSAAYVLSFGVYLNIHNMTGNKLVNYSILSSIQIPAQGLATLSITYLGRKLSHILFFTVCCISSLTLVPFVADEVVILIGACVLKILIGGLVFIVYLTVGEIFPTPMRGMAYGITAVVALGASTVMPPIIALGGSKAEMPYIFLAVISAAGALASITLPETFGYPLPQTIEEAEKIGMRYSYWNCVTRWNHPKKDDSIQVEEEVSLANKVEAI